MNTKAKIANAARSLAARQPGRRITVAELARAAGGSWPTARRHVGGPEGLPRFLAAQRGDATAGADDDSRIGEASDAGDTRGRVLDAAYRIFARRGYAEATLDDVAGEAGLTKGAVYWHFANKADLFLALIERRIGRELSLGPDRLEAAMRFPEREAGLAALIADEIERVGADPDWWWLSFEFLARCRDDALRRRFAEAGRACHDQSRAFAAGLTAAGVVALDVDANALAVLWRALVLGLARLRLEDPGQLDAADLVPGIARILWHGLQPAAVASQRVSG